jgi:hypothetical protein
VAELREGMGERRADSNIAIDIKTSIFDVSILFIKDSNAFDH